MTSHAGRVAFLSLPAEIRNQIYTCCLSLDSQTIPAELIDARRSTSHSKHLLKGVYSPYVSFFKLKDECWEKYCNVVLRSDPYEDIFEHGAIYFKDPNVWQLSRQIRHEPMSVYLRDSLSLDMRGHDGTHVRVGMDVGFRAHERW